MSDELLPLSNLAVTFKPGLYQHFKGGVYEALGVARHSDGDQELVIYRSQKDAGLWARPLAEFMETVERDGYQGPRFRYLEK